MNFIREAGEKIALVLTPTDIGITLIDGCADAPSSLILEGRRRQPGSI